ncbi:Pyridoxamine 5'-phosphate oxidase family protein OS=Streptomyces alboniger OX=132473 GN=CP975_23380 PE=4 SV=1 [Streptomyces alboniger]
MTADPLLDRALVEEATKKSGLIWVRGEGSPARALWHVWHEGAVHLVGDGPGEQPLPGLVDGGSAEVTVRSKDKGGRIVAWTAGVHELPPGSEAWEAAVAELKGKRLNAPDAEQLTVRWAEQCRVVRLAPSGVLSGLPEGSLAAAPLPSTATTRLPTPVALPRLLLKRKRR